MAARRWQSSRRQDRGPQGDPEDEPPEPLAHDKAADGRLIEAVRHDLLGDDGNASATAVRMIWTGDHLDAVRRLQAVIVS